MAHYLSEVSTDNHKSKIEEVNDSYRVKVLSLLENPEIKDQIEMIVSNAEAICEEFDPKLSREISEFINNKVEGLSEKLYDTLKTEKVLEKLRETQ